MTITDVALYASFSVSLMSFMICREVCERSRRVRGETSTKKRKEKTSRVRKATAFVPRVRRSNPARRVGPRHSAVETHEAAIRHVPSRRFLLTGTSVRHARVRGARAARKSRRRVGALSREAPYAAREPTDVPTRPPRASASHPPDPPARNTACPHRHRSIFFVRVLRAMARDAGRGWAAPGASRGRGAPDDGARIARRTLQKGLDMWFMALSLHDGVLLIPGVQRKGRLVRLGGVAGTARRSGARPAG